MPLFYDQSFSKSVNDTAAFAGGGDGVDNQDVIDYISITSGGVAQDFGNLLDARATKVAVSNGVSDRGVFRAAGGYDMQYITISTPGNSVDFGDFDQDVDGKAGYSNGTSDRGIWAGGQAGAYYEQMEYITISTTGNGTDFGDLEFGGDIDGWRSRCGLSNGTDDRGLQGGGTSWLAPPSSAQYNNISYVTISSTGNATDFGDLTTARDGTGNGLDNATNDRGVFVADQTDSDVLDYVTISSTGNATDFGDLLASRYGQACASNSEGDVGTIAGGVTGGVYTDTIGVITITSTGNATDHGDLTVGRSTLAGVSNTAS